VGLELLAVCQSAPRLASRSLAGDLQALQIEPVRASQL
jgi:hypothetical protein